jgi:hypothetical protein
MSKDEIIEKIKESTQNLSDTQLDNSGSKFIFAAIALIGVSYSLINNLGIEKDAQEFWPFGKFRPSIDPKENLIDACSLLISEIERL